MTGWLACPLCRDDGARYGFTVDARPLYYCDSCGALFRSEVRNPGPGPLACTELGFLTGCAGAASLGTRGEAR